MLKFTRISVSSVDWIGAMCVIPIAGCMGVGA